MDFAIDTGRRDVIGKLVNNKKGLNVGCGFTTYANKINVDVNAKKRGRLKPVECLASVLSLPFKDNSFEELIFSEVLEHVPKGTEFVAFKEMNRVLKIGGQLIITVPYGGLMRKIIDPFWWIGETAFNFRSHRHYVEKHIISLATKSGMVVDCIFTSGKMPWCSQLVWLLSYITKRDIFVKGAFRGSIESKGAVLFATLRKVGREN